MCLSILAILAIFEIFEIPDMDNEVDNPTKHTRTLLLINPWITDFAAFDLWSKPLGLLYLANILRRNGHRVRLIDCMDRYDPLLRASNPKEPKVKGYGIGPYHKEELPKPVPLSPIPRRYFRYGILEAHFWTHLTQGDEPALVLVTSMMTYWYPGVFRAIELVKTKWPDVPVLLGGVYATLCPTHALSRSGADFVLPGSDVHPLLERIDDLLGTRSEWVPDRFRDFPPPAWDLYPKLGYAVILTSRGCPYGCTFCASHRLFPGFETRDPAACAEEVADLYRHRRVRDFAFYDDALLLNAEHHLLPMLDEIIAQRLPIRFHTPNGLHAKEITLALAQRMHRAGFRTIRLSFESSDPRRQREMGVKITNEGLATAVGNLNRAGYQGKELEAYVLMGLPGQTLEEVVSSVLFVTQCGIKTKLARFSPIPGTREWDRAVEAYGFDPQGDPLLHNNSIHPFVSQDLTEEDFDKAGLLTRWINQGLDLGVNVMDGSAVSKRVREVLRRHR